MRWQQNRSSCRGTREGRLAFPIRQSGGVCRHGGAPVQQRWREKRPGKCTGAPNPRWKHVVAHTPRSETVSGTKTEPQRAARTRRTQRSACRSRQQTSSRKSRPDGGESRPSFRAGGQPMLQSKRLSQRNGGGEEQLPLPLQRRVTTSSCTG